MVDKAAHVVDNARANPIRHMPVAANQNSAVEQLRWLTTADLADILGLAKQTIYNRLQQSPHTLPTVTRVPHLRGPRWSQQAVRTFQAQFDPPSTVTPVLATQGRPTKTQQIARRLQNG